MITLVAIGIYQWFGSYFKFNLWTVVNMMVYCLSSTYREKYLEGQFKLIEWHGMSILIYSAASVKIYLEDIVSKHWQLLNCPRDILLLKYIILSSHSISYLIIEHFHILFIYRIIQWCEVVIIKMIITKLIIVILLMYQQSSFRLKLWCHKM